MIVLQLNGFLFPGFKESIPTNHSETSLALAPAPVMGATGEN